MDYNKTVIALFRKIKHETYGFNSKYKDNENVQEYQTTSSFTYLDFLHDIPSFQWKVLPSKPQKRRKNITSPATPK